MPTLKVTQVRSQIGQIAEHKPSPQLDGMLRRVRHLVKVEEG